MSRACTPSLSLFLLLASAVNLKTGRSYQSTAPKSPANAFISLFPASSLNLSAMPSITRRTYASRAAAHPIPVAKQLLECMDRKKTNLCVSVDVTKKTDLLRIANASGPYCCCIKVSTRR